MKEKFEINKGITLVALVIIIILLLVLAGISIASLTNSGLFEKARLAEQKSREAQEKEEGILSDYENKIGEYVNNNREQGNNKINYSTEEQIIGTWINNEPIYAKTIDLGTSFDIKTDRTELPTNIIPNDIDLPIKGVLYLSDEINNYKVYMPCTFYCDKGIWKYKAIDTWGATTYRHIYLYIEYTKIEQTPTE